MSQLRCMVHGMIATARQQILQELLLLKLDSKGIVDPTTTPCPVLYWDKLRDNAAERQMGWSFMNDPRNKRATSVPNPKD
ncbi:hypothetical protein ACJQWK_11941 [Exserohilum turcicum]